jgi:hypothetical protein
MNDVGRFRDARLIVLSFRVITNPTQEMECIQSFQAAAGAAPLGKVLPGPPGSGAESRDLPASQGPPW